MANHANYIKYYIRNALYAVSLFFVGGPVIQTFLSERGFSSSEIGSYVSVTGIAGTAVSLALSRLPDRAKKIGTVINILSICMIITGFFCISFLPLGLNSPAYPIFAAGIILAVTVSVKNLYEYKLPYHITEKSDYGRLISQDGAVTGIVSIFPGIAFSAVLGIYPYIKVMRGAFILSAACAAAAAAVNKSLKPAKYRQAAIYQGPEADRIKVNLLKLPAFHSLIIPNFLRGLTAGAVSVLAVAALTYAGFDSASSALIPTAAAVSQVAGSFIYMVMSKHLNPGSLCVLGGVMTAALPLCCAGGKVLFLAVYCAVTAGIMLVNYSVPDIIFKTIPYEIAGSYNIWRMALTTAGTAAGAAVCGRLMPAVSAPVLFAGFVVCQAVSSAAYYIYFCKKIKAINAAAI